jgi:hypothetical protein
VNVTLLPSLFPEGSEDGNGNTSSASHHWHWHSLPLAVAVERLPGCACITSSGSGGGERDRRGVGAGAVGRNAVVPPSLPLFASSPSQALPSSSPLPPSWSLGSSCCPGMAAPLKEPPIFIPAAVSAASSLSQPALPPRLFQIQLGADEAVRLTVTVQQ